MPLQVYPKPNDKYSQWYHLITLIGHHSIKVYSLHIVHLFNVVMIYIIMLLVELHFA